MASSEEIPKNEIPKPIDDIRECVQALLKEFGETGLPINDDNVKLHTFWAKLEYLLELEFNGKTTFISHRKTYWDFICKCLASKRFIHDGIKYVKSVNEFKTSLGRGRAFIRFCLMNKCLGDTLQQCFEDDSKTKEFYNETSLLIQREHSSNLISALYYLNEVQFDLSPVGHDLDVGWPTFAKKAPGLDWSVPSRTVSLSSLTSQNESLTSEMSHSGTLNNVDEVPNEHADEDTGTANTSTNSGAFKWVNGMTESSSQLQAMEVAEVEFLNIERKNRESELLAKINELEIEKRFQADVVEDLRNQLEMRENEKPSAVDECEKLKAENVANRSKVTKELDKLRVEIKRLSDENVRLDEDNTQLTEKIEKWKKCFNICTEKLSAKEKINENLEKQVKALKDVTAAAKDIVTVRTTETNQLRALVSELKSKNGAVAGESSSGSLGDVENENVELKSNIADLKNNVENLKRLVDDKSEALRQKDEVIADMEQTIQARETAMRSLEVRLAQSENDFGRLSMDNENLRADLDCFRTMVSEVQTAEEELENLENIEKSATKTDGNQEPEENDDQAGTSSGKTTVGYVLYDLPRLFPEQLVFSKTLRRLRSIISEKQDLGLKLKSYYDMNDSLISKVKEQETKLSSVTQELSQTKILIEQLKSAHSKLQTSEAILHYEIKEKRGVLEQMKRVLESSRSQWLRARQKQSESELEWQNLRADFASRVKQESTESGYTEDSNVDKDRTEPLSPVSLQSPSTSSADIPALTSETADLDPEPIPLQTSSPNTVSENGDLSVSQGDDDDCSSSDAAGTAQSSRTRMRLQIMEEQCKLLYNRLVSSLKRSECLDWKLSHLHEEHGGEHAVSAESSSTEENESKNEDQTSTNFDIVYVPFQDDNLKQSRGSVDDANDQQMEFCLNENEGEIEESSDCADVCAGELECEIPIQVADSSETENEIGLERCVPLKMAQALPKRVELLRKSKEDLEKNLKQLTEQQKESEAREAARMSEFGTLRSIIEDLETTVQRLEAEKESVINAGLEFRKHAGYIMKKDREERDDKYNALMKVKEEMELETQSINAQLASEMSKCQQATVDHNKCLDELMATREDVMALKFKLSTEAIKHSQVLKKSQDHEMGLCEMRDQMGEQERIIANLESQLIAIKTDRILEKNRQSLEMDTKNVTLITCEEECSTLGDELKLMTHALDLSNTEVQRLKQVLSETTAENNKLAADNKVYQSDSVDLKQKMVQLIKDKDMLWKRSEQLIFFQNLQSSERWLKDEEAPNCMNCRAEFSLTLRKHHCRLCGRIFCNKCSNNWSMTTSHSRKVRICDECVAAPSPVYSHSTSLNCDYEESKNQLEALLAKDINGQKETASDDSSISDSPTNHRVMDTSLFGRLFKNFHRTPKPTKYVFDDDEFIVISDEEISRSLSQSSPYAPAQPDVNAPCRNVTVCPLRNLDEIVNHSITSCTREIWINAGQSYSIPLRIENSVSLSWEFASEPKSIAFCLNFITEDEVNNSSYVAENLIPLLHCNTHVCAKRGRIEARKPGVYTFVFDNIYSRFQAKKVTFKIEINQNSAIGCQIFNSSISNDESTPSAEESTPETPSVEESASETPSAKELSAENPSAEESTAEQPSTIEAPTAEIPLDVAGPKTETEELPSE